MALSPRDRRALIIFGSVTGAALLLWVLVLRGGGEGPTEEAQPTPTPTISPLPTPRETPSPGVAILGGRDPFEPLITPGGGGGPTTSPPTGTTPPPTGPTSPPPTTPTVSPPPSPPETPPGGTSTKVGGHTVVLLSIFELNGEQMAQIEVDGEVCTVGEGQVFNEECEVGQGNFKLVSIQGTCATFLFGDERFTLCEQAPK
jgi:hypothetical protein